MCQREVVNAYLRLVQERSGGTCWCLNSFFWPQLRQGGHAAVRRWASRAGVDVKTLEVLLVPMNVGGNHWAIGGADLGAGALFYLDSLGHSMRVGHRPHRSSCRPTGDDRRLMTNDSDRRATA